MINAVYFLIMTIAKSLLKKGLFKLQRKGWFHLQTKIVATATTLAKISDSITTRLLNSYTATPLGVTLIPSVFT